MVGHFIDAPQHFFTLSPNAACWEKKKEIVRFQVSKNHSVIWERKPIKDLKGNAMSLAVLFQDGVLLTIKKIRQTWCSHYCFIKRSVNKIYVGSGSLLVKTLDWKGWEIRSQHHQAATDRPRARLFNRLTALLYILNKCKLF